MSVNDIAKMGGMARSGQCYASINSRAKKGENSSKSGGIKIAIPKGKDKEVINEPIIEAEVNEFLKFIKHSEYSIVKQLHKMLAKISLLALMLNSEPHKEAMLKVLKHAYVPHNAPVDKIDRLVGNIMMDNYISFSDDEIPPNGRGSTKALHITTKVKDCTLTKVLIDNGFSLNVMPLSTLMRLPIDRSHMKYTTTIVRAFDGTRREVTGEIEIKVCDWSSDVCSSDLKVLIDNGSSLNVMPLSTLMRLPIDRSHMKHTATIVRAFDGIRKIGRAHV